MEFFSLFPHPQGGQRLLPSTGHMELLGTESRCWHTNAACYMTANSVSVSNSLKQDSGSIVYMKFQFHHRGKVMASLSETNLQSTKET